MAVMPYKLSEDQKQFIRDNASKGGTWLAEALSIDRSAVYQLATREGFSAKKNGVKPKPHEKRLNRMKSNCSPWPKKHKGYKKLLVERDGLRCHYCDVMMTYSEAQIDHVLAKARGGTDVPTNLVLACFRCNSLKSTLCYTCPEFRNAIA